MEMTRLEHYFSVPPEDAPIAKPIEDGMNVLYVLYKNTHTHIHTQLHPNIPTDHYKRRSILKRTCLQSDENMIAN